MTGVLGGTVTGTRFREMEDATPREPWYELERFEDHGHGLTLVHHGETDSLGRAHWERSGRAGVVHGAFVDHEPTAYETFFERVLDDPGEALREVDGPFILACVDANDGRFVLATDKLGSRPCYYALDDGFVFGSSVASLLPALDDPQVNEQGVSDMLLMGNMWGQKTLVEEVRALPPATVLEYDVSSGTATAERYWKPDFTAAPTDGYIADLVSVYRRAMADAATTMDGDVGLWLSGGLDSRTLAGELARHADEFDSLTAYTYDANPRGGGNPELAAEVAACLDMDIETVELTPERFLPVMEEAIDHTDGMVRWATLATLSATFNLTDEVDVLLEGSGQGGLMGHHLRRRHLEHCDSAVDSMYQSEAAVSRETVRSLMTGDIDPLDSFRAAAARSDESQPKKVILDAHFDNHYARDEYASNRIAQNRAGVRVPFAHGALLEHAARLPTRYRMGTFPFTRGKIPYGVTRPKLGLTRAIGSGLESIRYERTGVAPKQPYPVHVAGFVATTSLGRLRSPTAYGGQRMADAWYREHEGFRTRLDELLDAAGDRPFFDSEELRRLRREHLDGEAHHMTSVLSSVTTLESWFGRHLD